MNSNKSAINSALNSPVTGSIISVILPISSNISNGMVGFGVGWAVGSPAFGSIGDGVAAVGADVGMVKLVLFPKIISMILLILVMLR